MSRTLDLRERSRYLLRLDAADLAYLESLPRRWLTLERLGSAGRVLLSVKGIAGVLDAPTLRLRIAPKVPLASLLLLLDEHPPTTEATLAGDHVADTLLETVATCFLGQLRRQHATGWQRGYREQALTAPILIGRLDIAEQIRRGPVRPEQLHQVHDAYTLDIPANQLPRAALDALRATPGLSPAARSEIERLSATLVEVPPLPVTEWTRPIVAPPGYGPLLDASRLVLAGLSGESGHGPGVGFVLELERLFERWLLRGLDAASGVSVEAQARRVLRSRGGPTVTIRPDALIHHDGEPIRVLDAKWKRLRRGRPDRADLYQMLAYAEILAVPEVMLVYPGTQTRRYDYPATGRGTRICCWTVRPQDRDQVVGAMVAEIP